MKSCELEKVSHPLDHRTFANRSGDGHASTAPKIQEPFIAENAQGAKYRIGVHAEHRRQVLGWWEALSGRCFASGNGAPDLACHLIVQGDVFGAVDLDSQHSAIHSSTMFGPIVNDKPAPVEVLIPEARDRQRRRYRRSAVLFSIIALLVGALVAFLITTASSGTGTTHEASKRSTVAAGRVTVLIRPVLCFAYPYVASQRRTGPVPACAAPYLLTANALNVSPNSVPAGYSSNTPEPDPALAGYPSSTRDVPMRTVLLGGLAGGPPVHQRWVLGPSEMRLSSSDVESASAQKNQTGQWTVTVHLSSNGAAAFDHLAEENFHQFVAIDMGGKVVSTPIIQPTQTAFSSFDGALQISGSLTASNAHAVAAAIKG